MVVESLNRNPPKLSHPDMTVLVSRNCRIRLAMEFGENQKKNQARSKAQKSSASRSVMLKVRSIECGNKGRMYPSTSEVLSLRIYRNRRTIKVPNSNKFPEYAELCRLCCYSGCLLAAFCLALRCHPCLVVCSWYRISLCWISLRPR